MAVTPDDVRYVAALARLSMTGERAAEFTAQLNTILEHMDALTRVDTGKLAPVAGIGAGSTPLAGDEGPPVPLARPLDEIAPVMRDGLFLVPRVSTHDAAEES
jgi:aspartyl-tRNA(Asn)/glutamyl-tRNA(Gln) amidotransferase subunit C